jgi:TetR/AcrR family transcriptional repressor of nem operon
MARPRTFDIDEAVDGAMLIFWEKGYAGTSLADLLDATELSKSSLYETFGSKRDLFLRTIDHFRTTRLATVGSILNGQPTAGAGIRKLLTMQGEHSRPTNSRQGCYLGKCAVDCAPGDTHVTKRVDAGVSGIRALFTREVERGQAAGEISTKTNAATTGAALTATFYGIQVMSSAGASRPMIARTIESVLDSIAALP